jgi:hypothetical protein
MAQTKQELSVGIGPSFFGWGDVTGISLTATYDYQFAKHFGIEPRFITSSAWRKTDLSYNTGEHYTYGYDYNQTGYLGIAASVVYTPFLQKGNFLKLKSGFISGTMAHSYGGNRQGGYPMVYSEFDKENLFGLIHTLTLRFINRGKFFLGTELSMLTSFSEGYYNCDGFVWNFMGGIKF